MEYNIEEILAHKRSMTLEQVINEELKGARAGTLDSYESPYDAVNALLDYYQARPWSLFLDRKIIKGM